MLIYNNIEKKEMRKHKIIKRRKKKSSVRVRNPIIECSICMSSEQNGLIIIVNDSGTANANGTGIGNGTGTGNTNANENNISNEIVPETGIYPIATLADCDSEIKFEGTIFYAPCRKHGICYECLRRLALSFDNHPVGQRHPYVQCPYPFEGGCVSAMQTPCYFNHTDIQKILTEHEYEMYRNHVDRFQFPGYEIIKCPRPVLINNQLNDDMIGECGAWILVPHEIVQTSTPGNLVLECNQNPDCLRRTCYHCRSNIRVNGFRRFHNNVDNEDALVIGYDPDAVCEVCITNVENTNPMTYNKYFYNPEKRMKDGKCLFFRNNELDIKTVVTQLEEMAESDNMYSRCFECLTVIYKTEQCNTITHCGIERCYACGRSGSHDQDLGDHWDTNGIKGCPRFDHSTFWNDVARCDFRCRESYCYSDEMGPCVMADHQHGISKLIEVRKRAHIYHALKSLLAEHRKRVIEYILTTSTSNNKLLKLLPRYDCSEYRCYTADVCYDFLKRCQRKLQPYEQSNEQASNEQASIEQASNEQASIERTKIYDHTDVNPNNVVIEFHSNNQENTGIQENIAIQENTAIQENDEIVNPQSYVDKFADMRFDIF